MQLLFMGPLKQRRGLLSSLMGPVVTVKSCTARIQNPHFFAPTPKPGESADEKMSLTSNPKTQP